LELRSPAPLGPQPQRPQPRQQRQPSAVLERQALTWRSRAGLTAIGPRTLWDLADLLPHRDDAHPLGCHRPRIPDRVVFDNLIQVLVFGCGYRRIADHFLWSAQDNFEWMDGFGNRSARSTSTSRP
jgi:hypothetical protein